MRPKYKPAGSSTPPFSLPTEGNGGQFLRKSYNWGSDAAWADIVSPFEEAYLWVQPAEDEDGHRTATEVDSEVYGAGFAPLAENFVIEDDLIDLTGETGEEWAGIIGEKPILLTYELSDGEGGYAPRAAIVQLVGDNFDELKLVKTLSTYGTLVVGPCTDSDQNGGHEVYVKLTGANRGAIISTNDTGAFIPAGGTTGQVLVKKSNADYDVEWQTLGS